MTPLIREASRGDLEAVLALYLAAGLDSTPLPVADHDAAWQRVQASGARVLLACCGAHAVGTLHLYLLPQLAHQGSRAAVVEAVAVHPEVQGQGIGRALMQHALAIAREAGCYKLALSSNGSRDAAHAFYDALGFQRHGISFVAGLA